jgi:hypothetical protein
LEKSSIFYPNEMVVAKGPSNLKRTKLSFKHFKVTKLFFKIKSLIISVSIFPFLFSGGSGEFFSLLFSISNILINFNFILL